MEENINKALSIAWKYGQIDDSHHKAWVIDQMVRALLGSKDKYDEWIEAYETPLSNNKYDYYEWHIGIAP